MSAHWFYQAQVEHAVEEVKYLLDWYRRGYHASASYEEARVIAAEWGIPIHLY